MCLYFQVFIPVYKKYTFLKLFEIFTKSAPQNNQLLNVGISIFFYSSIHKSPFFLSYLKFLQKSVEIFVIYFSFQRL